MNVIRNPRSNVSYISIPKSSSTTIKDRLYSAKIGFSIHTAKPLSKKRAMMADDFVFTFLREPTDRFVSGINTVLHRLDLATRNRLFSELDDQDAAIDGYV